VIGYGRRNPDGDLALEEQAAQSAVLVSYTESEFTNEIDQSDAFRLPLPAEARTYDLTGYARTGPAGRFRSSDFVAPAGDGFGLVFDEEIQYEDKAAAGKQRRLVEDVRTHYRPNDLGAAAGNALALLGLRQLESLALPGVSYQLAFTPGLIAQVYQRELPPAPAENLIPAPAAVLGAVGGSGGGYVDLDADGRWWIPSKRMFYSRGTADSPAVEMLQARAHFLMQQRQRDPFHTDAAPTETLVRWDDYDLLPEETIDALGNRMTCGERAVDPTQPLVKKGNDYRVLLPAVIMDANRNRSAVAFDAFGVVVGTAVMGKPEEAPRRGDLLDGFVADLTDVEIAAHMQNPTADPLAILARATTRIVFDLFAYHRTRDLPEPQPAVAYTIVRATHDADLALGEKTAVQHRFSYFDGLRREIQQKLQAEAGPAPKRDPLTGRIVVIDGQPEMTAGDVAPRWVGSGWTVFDHRGRVVRKFESFFTDTHRFEFDVRIGVSPITFHDPADRIVLTAHPNHTWEKTTFAPWRHETWDVNDTAALADPKTDPTVGHLFRRLPDEEFMPTWFTRRQDGALGGAEQRAAQQAAIHAATPTRDYFDALGRVVLTVVHNKFKRSDTPPADPPVEERYRTRLVMDIEGNQREVIDDKGRAVMRYDYDMLGHRIRTASMDSGTRWTLSDVTGGPLHVWNSRGDEIRTVYDQLRRPVESRLRQGGGAEKVVTRTVHGETEPAPEAANLRMRVVRSFDQAGVLTTDRYDFKGNQASSRRQFAVEYRTTLDWSGAVALEPGLYTGRARYDALNRPIQFVAPHSDAAGTRINVIQPTHNDAGMIEKVDVWLSEVAEPAALLPAAGATLHAVTNIDYDPKGQRTLVDYGTTDGAGISTTYTYDRETFRVTGIKTRRNADGFNGADRPGEVQNLHYTYDPIGNITNIRDDAQQSVFFNNRRVEPSASYTYDAVYRLLEATGREHLGQVANQPSPPTFPDPLNVFHAHLSHPGDGAAMGTYIERFVYDAVDNILSMEHRGDDPAAPGWTRDYFYDEASQLQPLPAKNNRLTRCTIGAITEEYHYDGAPGRHGEVTSMSHLPLMRWDYADRLQATARQVTLDGSTPETTWYLYDAAGTRARKITDRQAAAGDAPTRMNDRLYLGGFEIFRELAPDGTVTLQRETLHVLDDKHLVALVETRTDVAGSPPLVRYQFNNHLGSATLELDDAADIITYEEYYPYGSTSYQALRAGVDVHSKRYRFSRKERDEETGCYYHGARYYAPWMGRWISADPIGVDDGVNVFCYGRDNPITFIDPNGTEVVISYKEGDKTKTITYKYEKDRKVDASLPDFVKNTLKSLDRLVEKKAMNIKFGEGADAKTVDVLDTLIKATKKVTIDEETSTGKGNSYEKGSQTIHFLSNQGITFRKDSSKGWTEENTGRNSPSALLGHELIHAYNHASDPDAYQKRKDDTSTKSASDPVSFKNKEEEYVTKNLANQMNKTLGEDARSNYGRNYYEVGDPTSTKAKEAAKPEEKKDQKPAIPAPTPKAPEKKGAWNSPSSLPKGRVWNGLDMRYRRSGVL
jgi:RHS repeat-associated protein